TKRNWYDRSTFCRRLLICNHIRVAQPKNVMKLDFAITEADSREASRLYYRNLAPMGWFWDVALPFACTALGLGIYAYASGNRALAISLFACAAYLAKGCIAQWLAIYFKRAKNCIPGRHFEIDAGQYGMFVASTDGKSERTWSEFRNFCETKNL